MHAAALAISSGASHLVSESDVLLFSTDVTGTTAFMLNAMSRYPQRTRLLMHTGVNVGYRCGLLHSLSATHDVWRRYAIVVSTHPDVYLLPPAPAQLASALGRESSQVALLATTTKMFWHGRRQPRALLADLFVFRPSLLPSGPSDLGLAGSGSSSSSSGGGGSGSSSGGGGSSGGSSSSGGGSSGGSSSSNFPDQQHDVRRSAKSSFWANASFECSFFYLSRAHNWSSLPANSRTPEMALSRVQLALNASFAELPLARSAGRRGRILSSSGVWHAHNASEVELELTRRGQRIIIERASATDS